MRYVENKKGRKVIWFVTSWRGVSLQTRNDIETIIFLDFSVTSYYRDLQDF